MDTSQQNQPEVIVQQPEPCVINTKLQYSPYESLAVSPVNHEIQVKPNIKPMTRWQEIVAIITLCVLGMVISVAIGGIYVWYYGVISGIGVYSIPRFLYKCYLKKYDQSRVAPTPVTEPMTNDPTRLA